MVDRRFLGRPAMFDLYSSQESVGGENGQQQQQMPGLLFSPQFPALTPLPEIPELSADPLFIELIELREGSDDHYQWEERARWIKYEEDCDPEFHTWDQPHISVDYHHNFALLMKSIHSGLVLVDKQVKDLPDAINQIADGLVEMGRISRENKHKFTKCLLQPHHHERPLLIPPRKSMVTLPNFINILRKDSTPRSIKISPPLHRASFSCSHPQSLTTTPLKLVPSAGQLGQSNQQRVSVQHFPKRPSIFRDLQSAWGPTNPEEEMVKRLSSATESLMVLTGRPSFPNRPLTAFLRIKNVQIQDQALELPIPLRFIFVHLEPHNDNDDESQHHQIGRAMCILMNNQQFKKVAETAQNKLELIQGFHEFVNSCALVPPNVKINTRDLDKMNYLIADLKNHVDKAASQAKPRQTNESRINHSQSLEIRQPKCCLCGLKPELTNFLKTYKRTITNAFNQTCLFCAMSIFVFCLVATITFGGILGETTNQTLDTNGMLWATSLNGILFGMLAGQPLLILGPTGPMMVIEEFVHEISARFEVDFLAARLWISVWVAVFSLVVVALEKTLLTKYFGRFSEEIFVVVIALTYLYEPAKWLAKTYKHNPILLNYSAGNETLAKPLPNVALLSTLLMLGATIVAFLLPKIRYSKMFNRKTRRLVATSSLFVSILIMVLLDRILTRGLYVAKRVHISEVGLGTYFWRNVSWKLTSADGIHRKWLYAGAMLPALLTLVVLFIEARFVGTTIENYTRRVKDGQAMLSSCQTDLLTIAGLLLLNSVLGLPWLCVAPVRSLHHISELSVTTKIYAPGERPTTVDVVEQRLTNVVVHLAIGLSVFAAPYIHRIPVCVLFGIFVYFGLATLNSTQLVGRLKLMLLYSTTTTANNKQVRNNQRNLFTLVQLAFVAAIFGLKVTRFAMLFPLVLILSVPVRHFLLPRLMFEQELVVLDNEDRFSIHQSQVDDEDLYNQAYFPI